MALAPRPRTNAADKGGNRASVKGAAGKAEQRKRNKTASGSSGLIKPLAKYPSLAWEEVEDDVEHVVDLALKIQQAQLGANGYFLLSCALPAEYAHAGIDAHMASNEGMLYVRMYKVPISKFLERMMEEAEEDGNDPDS
jgi:hypothetical protein